MRKTLLVLLALATGIAQAQIPKKATLIGGQLIVSNMNANYGAVINNHHYQSIELSVGKAFRENKVFGVTTKYTHWKSLNPTVIDSVAAHSNGVAVGVFYRQYKNLGSKFYLFAQLDLGFGYSYEKQKEFFAQNDNKFSIHSVYTSITPGLSYQIFRKVQAELTLPNFIQAYYWAKKSTKTADPAYYQKDKELGVDFNFTNLASLRRVGIGVRFIL